MSDEQPAAISLDLNIDQNAQKGTLTYDCPACDAALSLTIKHEDLRNESGGRVHPLCRGCGWSASFSVKVEF